MSMKVCEAITNRIVRIIEEGGKDLKWTKSWSVIPQQNLVTKHQYTGVNRVTCSIMSQVNGWSSFWLTVGQALSLNGRIMKSEWNNYTPIVCWRLLPFKFKNPVTGEEEERHRLVPVKFFKAYNASQTEGIEIPELYTRRNLRPIESIDQMFAALPEQPVIKRGGNSAYYSPLSDHIQLPELSAFKSAEHEALVRTHEASHWTGAKNRLNRKTLTDASFFGSPNYSEEEVTVELATSWIMAHHGLDEATINDSAGYLAGWIKQMKTDPKVLFRVGKEAERIYKYLLGTSLKSESSEVLALASE